MSSMSNTKKRKGFDEDLHVPEGRYAPVGGVERILGV